jgi:hypothetical protein
LKFEESKNKKPKKFKWKGIPFEEFEFIDKYLKITGKWEEFFDFPLPDALLFLEENRKHEYLIDNESPMQCVSIECFDVRDPYRTYFMRGVFSIKQKNSWFQYLRYEVKNDLSLEFMIREIDYDNESSDPYLALERIETFNFKKKFKIALDQLKAIIKN